MPSEPLQPGSIIPNFWEWGDDPSSKYRNKTIPYVPPDKANQVYTRGNQLQQKIDEHLKDPQLPRYTIVVNNVTGEGKIPPGVRLIMRKSNNVTITGDTNGTSNSPADMAKQQNKQLLSSSDLPLTLNNVSLNWNI